MQGPSHAGLSLRSTHPHARPFPHTGMCLMQGMCPMQGPSPMQACPHIDLFPMQGPSPRQVCAPYKAGATACTPCRSTYMQAAPPCRPIST